MDPELWGPLILLTFLIGGFGFSIWWPRHVHGVYVATAKRLGLAPPTTSPNSKMQWIKGDVRGVEVDIQTYLVDQPGSILRRSGDDRPSTRTRVAAYGAPMDLDLRAQSLVDTAYQVMTHPDIQLGDPRFDREVIIAGSPRTARMALDATTRVLVLDLLRQGGEVVRGKVEIDFDGPPTSVERLTQAAIVVVNLTRRLKAAAQDEADRIRRIITSDPNVGVRRATLTETLAARPEVVTTLIPSLLEDRDPGIRAIAAPAAGAEGRPVLLALLRPDTEPGSLLMAVLALAEDRGPDLEPRLLPLLGTTDEVRVAAARILARVGTAASVEPLLPLTSGLTTDGEVKRAARAALTAIRARIGPAEAGGLTLAESATGAVSLAAGAGGAVSVPAPRPVPEDER